MADPQVSDGTLDGAPPRVVIRTDLIGKTQEKPPVDPWAAYPDAPPQSAGGNAPPTEGQDQAAPWDAYPDTAPEKAPHREIGGGEAMGRGLAHGLTLGLSPAISGAEAAADPDIEAVAKKFGIDPEAAKGFLDTFLGGLPKAAMGAGRLAYDSITHEPTLSEQVTGPQQTPAQKAYGETRKASDEENKAASEQHPYLYGGADIVGSAAVPLPGFGMGKVAAPFLERVGRGVSAGGTAGAAIGAGNAIGEGKDAGDIVKDAASGAIIGGTTGGVLNGAIGPRVKSPVSPAQQAVDTSHDLGAPLPKALSYDSKSGQAAGQLARQTPITGHMIDTRAQKTLKAAEDKMQSMAGDLSPDTTRSGTDAALRTSADNALEFNKRAQNGAYDSLRNSINPDQRVPLPHTLKALKEIEYRRMASGASRKQARAGLEEAWELATHPNGGGFNGVHRRRAELRNPPTALKMTNPGYNAGDYNLVAAAMSKDLHGIVRQTSVTPQKSSQLFVDAEKNFGILAEENKLLEKIRDANKEGGIVSVLNSTKEKGGFLTQLQVIKKSLPPKDFERISGLIMSELGKNVSGDFTFAQFVRQWRAMSDPAKALLFSPQHRGWIDNIAQLAEHVKDADKYRNTSNTAGALITFELLKSVVELGIAAGAGALSGHEFITGAGGIGAGLVFGSYMASPAKASSLSKFVSAWRGITANEPNPIRVSAFKAATRNLANNIHVPFDRLWASVSTSVGGGSRGLAVSHASPPEEK